MFRRSLMLLCVVGMAACSNNGVTRYQVEEPEQFPVLHAVGYAIVDVQPGPSKSEKVLQALRASKLDAYRELTEQVYGQSLQGATTLRDAVQTSNQLQASVDGMIAVSRFSYTPKPLPVIVDDTPAKPGEQPLTDIITPENYNIIQLPDGRLKLKKQE